MERELDSLIAYFENHIHVLKKELEQDPNNEYFKGRIKGMQHAITITRMFNIDETGRNQLDVIIDTPIYMKDPTGESAS